MNEAERRDGLIAFLDVKSFVVDWVPVDSSWGSCGVPSDVEAEIFDSVG